MSLRRAVIRLAQENPGIREHLLPILRRTARVPSKLESQGKLRELEKKHGRTKAYYAAALKELKAGNLAPSAVVGGGYKSGKKVAIKWLEEQMAKTAGRIDQDYIGDGLEFANLLSKEWRTVKYDERRDRGSANLGGLKIDFVESQSDSAVIVTIREHPFMKGSPEQMMEALKRIKAAWMVLG